MKEYTVHTNPYVDLKTDVMLRMYHAFININHARICNNLYNEMVEMFHVKPAQLSVDI